jgi:hypothetical protein
MVVGDLSRLGPQHRVNDNLQRRRRLQSLHTPRPGPFTRRRPHDWKQRYGSHKEQLHLASQKAHLLMLPNILQKPLPYIND